VRQARNIGPYTTGRGEVGLASRFLHRVYAGSRAVVGAPWNFTNGCTQRPPYVEGPDAWASRYGDNAEWLRIGPRSFKLLSPRAVLDIKSAGCPREQWDDACTHPADVPGRLKVFERVRSVQALTPAGSPLFDVAGRYAIEVARVRLQGKATHVLERLATWARVTAVIAGNVEQTWEFSFGSPPPGQGISIVSTPFPFPISEASGGASVVTSLEWQLVEHGAAMKGSDIGALLATAGQPAERIPSGRNVLTPWSDSRYVWGSRFCDGNDWIIGGRKWLRLFCVIEVSGDLDPGDTGITAEVGGKLTGYTAATSPTKSAIFAATRRS